MFVCVFAKTFPALASQSCCEVSRPRAVREYEYRLLDLLLLLFFTVLVVFTLSIVLLDFIFSLRASLLALAKSIYHVISFL